MVKITNGHKTFEVSVGAFEQVYKGLGFRLAGTKQENKSKGTKQENNGSNTAPPAPPQNVDDGGAGQQGGDDFAELLEKPLSQWNKNEVKGFAEANGIDLTGTKNVGEAKDRVKAFLDEQAKNGTDDEE